MSKSVNNCERTHHQQQQQRQQHWHRLAYGPRYSWCRWWGWKRAIDFLYTMVPSHRCCFAVFYHTRTHRVPHRFSQVLAPLHVHTVMRHACVSFSASSFSSSSFSCCCCVCEEHSFHLWNVLFQPPISFIKRLVKAARASVVVGTSCRLDVGFNHSRTPYTSVSQRIYQTLKTVFFFV